MCTCVFLSLQYVNPAYERLTGFSMEEVAGKDSRELKSERNKPDLQETINGQLKKGKVRFKLSTTVERQWLKHLWDHKN